MPEQVYSVSDFHAIFNQILDHAFAGVTIEGEVSSFKTNQNKFIFFDLKDEASCVCCFMMLHALRFPLEDGMRVRIRATPRLTPWGKFSLTVQSAMPIGEGNLKKSFELLKQKLITEKLFDPARKRPLPDRPTSIGVISSTDAAGYADFCKILNERWGGLKVFTAHVQVQGTIAADQIIQALQYFNEHSKVEAIAIIRGGGSADDLSIFNDEQLVRAIAASRIPIVTGIGHEIDESLSDLAADVVASTPSNAAQILTKDKAAVISNIKSEIEHLNNLLNDKITATLADTRHTIHSLGKDIVVKITTFEEKTTHYLQILNQLNPETVLERGYALVTGKVEPGSTIKITTSTNQIQAEVKNVTKRNH